MTTRIKLGLAICLVFLSAPLTEAQAQHRVSDSELGAALDSDDVDVVRGALNTLSGRPAALTPGVISKISRAAVRVEPHYNRLKAMKLLTAIGPRAGPHLHADFHNFRPNSPLRSYGWLAAVAATQPDAADVATAMIDNVESLLPMSQPEVARAAAAALDGDAGSVFARAHAQATTDERRWASLLLWSSVAPDRGGLTLEEAYDMLRVTSNKTVIHAIAQRTEKTDEAAIVRLIELLGNLTYSNNQAIVLERLSQIGPSTRRAGPYVCKILMGREQVFAAQLYVPLKQWLESVGYGPELGCLAYLIGANQGLRDYYRLLGILGEPGLAVIIRDLKSNDRASKSRAFQALAMRDEPPWMAFEFVRHEVNTSQPHPDAVKVWGTFGGQARGRLRELASAPGRVGIMAIGQLGRGDEAFLLELVRRGGTPAWPASRRLIQLEVAPAEVASALVFADEPDRRLLALRLADLGEPGQRALVRVLRNEDDPERIIALLHAAKEAWRKGWKRPPELTPVVVRLTDHESAKVRHSALTSFWGTSERDGVLAVPALRRALDRPEDIGVALEGAAQIRGAAAPLVPRFIELLEDPTYRRAALQAIQMTAEGGNPALPKLLELAKATPNDPHVIKTIGWVMTPSDDEAFELLRERFKSDNRSVAKAAAFGLMLHSNESREVLKAQGVIDADVR